MIVTAIASSSAAARQHGRLERSVRQASSMTTEEPFIITVATNPKPHTILTIFDGNGSVVNPGSVPDLGIMQALQIRIGL